MPSMYLCMYKIANLLCHLVTTNHLDFPCYSFRLIFIINLLMINNIFQSKPTLREKENALKDIERVFGNKTRQRITKKFELMDVHDIYIYIYIYIYANNSLSNRLLFHSHA